MDFEANHAKRLTEILYSELAQVVVFDNRGHLHAVVGELVAQPRRCLPLGAQNQLHKQSYACAVASSKLATGEKAFADALRVRLVADALGVAERSLELRVRLARQLGGRRRRRRGLTSTGRAASLAAALAPASLILPAGGGARWTWDRSDVGRKKVGSARSLILVWRVDPARRVAPGARPGGGRSN